jgi:ABC-type transport system substrate-binding protein
VWAWAVCLVCVLAGPARAEGERATAYVGVFIHDVTEFDVKDGTFEVDAELWARWRGELDADQIRLANAGRVERVLLSDEHDADWRAKRWRVRGTMRGDFGVERFPFDVQRPEIVVELPERAGALAPDMASSGMAPRFSLTDWYYTDALSTRTSAHEYASDMGSLAGEAMPTRVARVAFAIELRRPTAPVGIKLFLPVGIILLVVFVSLFLPSSLIRTRSSIAVTALLSCFAFQFTVNRSLPAVTYLTLADQLFLVAYLMSALALMESVLAYRLEDKGHDELARVIDLVTKVGAPLLGLCLVWVALPEPEPTPSVDPASAPALARASSARDTVRIGTTLLPSVSSPMATMTWGVGIEHAPCVPLYVEHIAGVDTPAVELLAGGELEVTWTIRKGARWSDGKKLTSDHLALGLRTDSPDALVEVRTPNLRTAIARYDERVSEALECPFPYPAHVARQLIEEGGSRAWTAHKREHVVPTLGPYVVTTFEPGARVVAEMNRHFIGEPPAIARVEITRYDDPEALAAAYEAGELDLVYPNSLTPELMERVGRARPDDVHMEPGAFFIFVAPDLSDPRLDDLETRRALLQAIDRERIRREVYPAGGRVAHSPIPGADLPGLTRHAHDPEAAREVLARQGFAQVTLSHRDAPLDTQIAGMIAEDLRAVGVEVTLTAVESSFRALRQGGWGGLMLGVTRGTRTRDPLAFFNVPYDGRYDDEARHTGYGDEVARLKRLSERALYPERRLQFKERIEVAYSELLPTLPIVFANQRVLARPELRGWQTPPDETFMYRLDTWWFAGDAED